MAKLKTDTATTANAEVVKDKDTQEMQGDAPSWGGDEYDGTTSISDPESKDTTPQPTPQTPTPPKAEAKESKKEDGEPDSHTLSILAIFKNYESLYIDSSGSTFRVGTPERIRGGAKLYTNPYFKK
ncbi:MAG: hypothetical protein SNI32_08605 [Rikenellaceae bacterium]